MDVESAMLFKSRFNNAAPMVNPLTSGLADIVEPVFMQEQKGSLMQHPEESTRIGQEVTQIILTSRDSQTLLARTAKAVGEIFQVDVCLIVARVNQTMTTQTGAWFSDNHLIHEPKYKAQLLQHQGQVEDLADVNPLAIADLQSSEVDQAFSWYSQALACRAVMRNYTQFQTGTNGVIVLGRSQPHEWTTQEKELLGVVSESVAVAISQVLLTQQVQTATQHQTLLNQLSVAIRSDFNLEDIFQIAIRDTAQALNVSHGLLLLLKYTDPLFKNRPSKHLPKTEVTVTCEWLEQENSASQATPLSERNNTLLNQSFWLSESSLCQQAFRNAPEPIVIATQHNVPDVEVNSDRSIFDQTMQGSVLIVPLVGIHSDTSTVLGFLVLQHHQPRSWHTNEIELVKWVSTQVSTTLIQNQTLRQVQSLVDDRTAQLQRSLEVQAKLYEKTRRQIDQLQQLNQLKEEFMSSMSHELRTPLTTMSLAIRMLRQPELPLERRQKYLSILEQECNKEIDLINDLLSLQRLESDQSHLQPQKIDLMLMIKELAESFEQKWVAKRLTLSVESPAPSLMLNTDPDSLNRILLELLTNAGKYSDPDTRVCLQVTQQAQQSGNQVVLTLSNTGAGIQETDLKHIFDKFRRGQGVTQQAVQGTGLGLALVKCLVQHLNGTIDVSSCPSKDSQTFIISFTVTLPQFQQH
jgi:signal transduction histidine kinase